VLRGLFLEKFLIDLFLVRLAEERVLDLPHGVSQS
jgi:hypothetical protein